MIKKIVQFFIILTCTFLLIGKEVENNKYNAKFEMSDEALKNFQNKDGAKDEIRSIILNYYNQVWEIFENNKEKICDEEIRAVIELFGLKQLNHYKKVEI